MSNPHMLPLPSEFTNVIEKVKRVDERGLVYYLEYDANYYDLESYLEMLVKPGCSTFLAKNMKGESVMCRNYDFRHFRYNKETTNDEITGLTVVVKGLNPKARYKSLGLADGFWMDVKNGSMFEGTLDDGKTDISALAFSPFLLMDGMNEMGLSVSIMHLTTENTWIEIPYVDYDSLSEEKKKKAVLLENSGEEPKRVDREIRTGFIAINRADKKAWKVDKNNSVKQEDPNKKTVYHPVLMRLMLDNCKNVDEAIYLANSVNVKSAMADSDYHIMVCDKTGKSVILEWVYNELKVLPTNHATNFYMLRDDHYGYGVERDDILKASLKKYEKGMPLRVMRDTLSIASQDARDKSDLGFTQWSSMYNLETLKMSFYMHMDYEKEYSFEL